VVGSNTARPLDPEEFRGFALADDVAPAVFVNGADTKSAQMFTLAHELAHVWLGQTGVSDERLDRFEDDVTERWCNAVAAELLVPIATLRADVPAVLDLAVEVPRLARLYKVSTLVILRRLHELGRLGREAFWAAHRDELARLGEAPASSGGDFYRTQPARVSRRFARAVIVSTLEGQTLYRDAFRMLGIQKTSTFDGLAEGLGAV
jgi:Zn-dependent peptidase ImmA (M78 family)